MEVNGPSVPTFHSTEHMKSRLGLAISYKSLYFFNLSLECVLLFAGMRKGLLSFSNKPKIHVQVGSIVMKSEMRIIFCIVSREVQNYNFFWK